MNIALAEPDSGLPSILRVSARSFHPWFTASCCDRGSTGRFR
jgi:hypothetical protein